MPLRRLRKMSDGELASIVVYLRSLPPVRCQLSKPEINFPVKHRVDNALPPTYCKLCRQKHGAGNQN
jgi:hypothetical protein